MGLCESKALKLQQQYRDNKLSLAKLSTKESELLFTPPLSLDIFLIDDQGTKYIVKQINKGYAILEDLNNNFLHHKFLFDPLQNTLTYKTSKENTNEVCNIINRESTHKGFLTLGDLSYLNGYIERWDGKLRVHYEYAHMPDSVIWQIVDRMNKTEDFHKKLKLELTEKYWALVKEYQTKYNGRVIKLDV